MYSQALGNITPDHSYQFELSPPSIPEEKLWLYTLAEGIREAAAGRISQYGRERARTSDYVWVFQDQSEHIGSFLWICKALDIEPYTLRKTLKRKWSQIVIDSSRVATIILEQNQPSQYTKRCQTI